MDTGKIDRKIKGSKYSSAADLRADFHRIFANAEFYNTPGRGAYGGPGAGATPVSQPCYMQLHCEIPDPVHVQQGLGLAAEQLLALMESVSCMALQLVAPGILFRIGGPI